MTLQSRSGTQPPTVDGALDEWGGSLAYVNDESVRMSAQPTDSLLYVAVAIQDRALIRSVATNGLIVWVDPMGGKQHTYGIQYPLGLQRQRSGQNAPETAAPDPNDASQPAQGLDQVSLAELEIIRDDSTRNRIPAQFSSGLRAEAVLGPGSLIYELAIPLANTPGRAEQHRLRTALRSPVGLGLEVRKDDDQRTLLAPQDQGIPSVTGGGRKGRRGRRGRRGRGRQRQQGQQQSASQSEELPTLEVWTRVVSEGEN